MSEQDLRERIVDAEKAQQMLQGIREPLDDVREQVVTEFKALAADDHEGRRHAQCMLEAIDRLEGHFEYLIGDGKMAAHELTLLQKAARGAARLFGT